MFLFDPQSIEAAKFRFRLKRNLAQFRSRLFALVGRAFKATWSLKGAFGIAFAGILVGVVNLLVSVHGKLVILPFEVHSSESKDSLGTSFAGTLAATLNDYRTLYPSSEADRPKIVRFENSFDLLQEFMSDLPRVNIPHSSPLNRGSIAFDAIKVGGFSIPLGQIIFDNFALLHRDVLRGAIEIWDDEVRVRIRLPSGKEVTISDKKSLGFRTFVDRAAVELLKSERWLSPFPMRPLALIPFTDGLRNYSAYAESGEPIALTTARERYARASQLDEGSDLARLHLATTQYDSWQASDLRNAVENFGRLRASSTYANYARVSHIASLLRYIERTPGCDAANQYLDRVLQEVNSWNDLRLKNAPERFERLVLRGGALHSAAIRVSQNNPCSAALKLAIPSLDPISASTEAEVSYRNALKLLADPSNKDGSDLAKRRSLQLRLRLMYVLHDKSDILAQAKRSDASLVDEALEIGVRLADEKSTLPDNQKASFAPHLLSSIAEDYLRLAALSSESKKAGLVELAIARFTAAVANSSVAAPWSTLRLAELEFSRGRPREALEWLSAFANTSAKSVPLAAIADQRALSSGVFIERKEDACQAIDLLQRANTTDEFNILTRVLYIDVLQRAGKLKEAAQVLQTIPAKLGYYAMQWRGDIMAQKVALTEAKVSALSTASTAAPGHPRQSTFETILTSSNPALLFDLGELAIITQNEELLARVKLAIDKISVTTLDFARSKPLETPLQCPKAQ